MNKPKVFISRIIPEPALERIEAVCDAEVWTERLPPPRSVLLEKVVDKEGVITLLTDRVDDELLEAAGSSLKVVSNYAIGVDNVDVAAATARKILVCNTPDVLTETTADLTFALILGGARRVVEGVELVRKGDWLTWEPQLLLGQDVYGATLGVVGLGRIGAAVARRGAKGFGMRVVYLDPSASPAVEVELGARRSQSLAELLSEADVVSLHAPLTPETHHMLNDETIALMKPSAVLVNTARGPLIDTDALTRALQTRRIAFAGLDVTEPEPLPAEHPLVGLQNCMIVPHIGSASRATRRKMATMAAENMLSVLRGERPPHVVNPEVFI